MGIFHSIPHPPSQFDPISSTSSTSPTSGSGSATPGQFSLSEAGSPTPFAFYATPGAGASATALNRAGVAAAIAVPMPYRGNVIAISLSSTASISTGSLTLAVRKDGVVMNSFEQRAELTWTAGDNQIERFNINQFGFVRDSSLDLIFTTTAAYLPTTAVIEGIIWIVQDTSEIV